MQEAEKKIFARIAGGTRVRERDKQEIHFPLMRKDDFFSLLRIVDSIRIISSFLYETSTHSYFQ